jgi:uncharacterized protein YceK
MKKLRLPILFIALLTGCSTTKLVTTPKEIYETIVEVPASKSELYIRANEWMIVNFKDARSIIQFQDKEDGTIIGKYLLHFYPQAVILSPVPGFEVYALIKIMVKDKNAKIAIEPQNQWHFGTHMLTVYDYSPEQAEQDIQNLISDFTSFIRKETNW